ncbi:MAG: hypothetical protein PVS2B2_15070 [Candidatus Acidiferrum sp.]
MGMGQTCSRSRFAAWGNEQWKEHEYGVGQFAESAHDRAVGGDAKSIVGASGEYRRVARLTAGSNQGEK